MNECKSMCFQYAISLYGTQLEEHPSYMYCKWTLLRKVYHLPQYLIKLWTASFLKILIPTYCREKYLLNKYQALLSIWSLRRAKLTAARLAYLLMAQWPKLLEGCKADGNTRSEQGCLINFLDHCTCIQLQLLFSVPLLVLCHYNKSITIPNAMSLAQFVTTDF